MVAIPLGLGSAIYLSEYASPRVRKAVKPVLELLAGVPTIVFGYFALTFFTPEILKNFFTDLSGFNALSAGIIMGFMVMPTIASISEDAMSSVPASLREGSFGLGANRLQTSLRGSCSRRAVGHRRLGRARRLAGRRRDDDRADRRRPDREPHRQPDRVDVHA